jgi:phosphoadenosine phosphosulfate reductase
VEDARLELAAMRGKTLAQLEGRHQAVFIRMHEEVNNPGRGFPIISPDGNFGSLKVSPFFHWTDAQLDAYLAEHGLPNEWDYFDPAKADEKRECGLHAAWGGKALAK